MADLENMLLEAAGRTSSPVIRKRHKPRNPKLKRNGSDDDSRREEESEEEEGNAAATGSKKASSSRSSAAASSVPLKKRLDLGKRPVDNEGGEGGSSEEESDEDVGSDLYKNEDDKQRLAKMTELEREMILSDRAAKKGEKEFKQQMRMKIRDNNNSNSNANATAAKSQSASSPFPPISSAKVRSSARHAEKTAAKGDVLSELRAKRMKQQVIDTTTRGGAGKPPPPPSTSKGVSLLKRKSRTAASSSSSSSQSESGMRVSDSERDSSSSSDGGLADSDDEDDKNNLTESTPTFDDIKEITIRRSRLVKWLSEPFFEDLIAGCFVRIGIGKSQSGPVYRLCMVQSVDNGDPNRPYKVENRMTHKHLICVWGSESSAKRFQVAVVSDSAPTEKEFRQWVREIERTSSQMPSKMSVAEKREAIRRTNSYVYSAATVKQMLEEKKSRPVNVAVEKDKLKRLLEIAKSKGDEAEVERILAKVAELEESRKEREKGDARAVRLAEMNRKNKVENFKSLSEHRNIVNANLKAGEEGYDPFSRRWTRSRNYYNAEAKDQQSKQVVGKEDQIINVEEAEAKDQEKDDNAAAAEGEGGGGNKLTTKVGVEATELALKAAANAGKLVDTLAPVDGGTELNFLHDFELPISLATLKDYGGPHGLRNGFLARKQKIEATVGLRVPENDGGRHALTLTISDYKRRRGLL